MFRWRHKCLTWIKSLPPYPLFVSLEYAPSATSLPVDHEAKNMELMKKNNHLVFLTYQKKSTLPFKFTPKGIKLFIVYNTTTKIPWNKVCQPETSIGRLRESVQSPALFRLEQQLTHCSRPLSEGKKSSRSEYFWQVGRLGYLSMQRAFSSSSACRSIWYFQSSISLKVLYLQSSKSLRLQSVQCVICKQFGVLKPIGGFRSYLAQNFYFPLLNRWTC